MTYAKFSQLTGGNIGIIRVYDSVDTVEPAPYKFFTVVEIDGDTASIHGMYDSKITLEDLRAMDVELSKIGVKFAAWQHNKKKHTYRLRN